MSLGNYSIGRAGDRTYFIKTEGKVLSKFHVEDTSLKAETAYNLSEKAAERYVHKLNKHPDREFKTIRFTHAGRKWKIVEKEQEVWHSYILKFLHIIFFHKAPTLNSREFSIVSAYSAPAKHDKTRAKARRAWKKVLPSRTSRYNYQVLSETLTGSEKLGLMSAKEYRKGVRGKVELSNEPTYYKEHYSDPYTRLASFAFERFEPRLKAKEHSTPFDCKYRIILKDNELLLVDRKSPLATQEALQEAGIAYNDYLVMQYGQEKVDYLKHLAKLKKDTLSELTPEHIFRINACTTNLEIQDIQTGIDLLVELSQNAGLDSDSLILDFIPQHLAIGVKKALFNDNPTVAEFKEWIFLQGFDQPITEISNEMLQEWLKIFLPNEEELDRAFTGKKILDDIKGVYACGQFDKFKPWLDQQELTQVFPSLIESASFESYLEKLTHIVVKKHLARRHPTEDLRVGALIPAPPAEEGGVPRWYHVTSCLTNEYNYSYTLESVCNDPTLPAIKLCRNTSPSPYALYAKKSIINDLNMLNSPGYMGINMLDEHEEAFFNKRTIPLWVGYKELAMRKMEESAPIEEIHSLLENANEALLRSEQEKYKPLSFREILKKHDAILNELYLRNEHIYNYKGKNLSPKFLSLFKKIVKAYMQVDLAQYETLDPTLIQSHSDKLKKLLEKILLSELDPREQFLINELIHDLEGSDLEAKTSYLSDFNDNTFSMLAQLQNEEFSYETLVLWASQLEQIAKERQEDLASKLAQSTVAGGQSLGGALAQVLIARHYTNKERIPIPGQSCTLAEFDAPAINAEDNHRFLAFGNTHKELLNALDVKFHIFRRQEVGDIAPVAGEEHLGAVFTREDAEAIEQEDSWLTFDVALNKRSKKSQREEIAFAKTVHDTRFLEGKNVAKGTIIIEEDSARRELVRDENEAYDYVELRFDPYVQGIFDSRGKKGDFEEVAGKQIYSDLYHKIWRCPRFQVSEGFRKSTDYVASCIRKMLLSGKQEDRSLKTNDLMGRVAVFKT